MQTIEKEKILIYENEQETRDTRVKVKAATKYYDVLLKIYRSLGVPVEITSIPQLYELADDPASFVKKAFVDQLPDSHEITGKDGRPVKLKRSFLEDQLVLPDLTKLEEVALSIRRAARLSDEKITQFDLYRLTDDGVAIDDEELAQELERWRRYATTEEEQERYAYAKKLCDILNEGRESYWPYFPSRDELEKSLRVVSKKGLKYVPNDQFVKPYNR